MNTTLYVPVRVEYEHLRFVQHNQTVKGIFYNYFEFELKPEELTRIAPSYAVDNGALVFDAPKRKVLRRANHLIEQKLLELKSKFSGKQTLYIDEQSGIPLIGSLSFGLIDRNTNCIEIRLNTSCNLTCIFCSVGEGRLSFNATEYLVETDYLIKILKELIAFKGCEVDIHIGSQGEPMLYARIEDLIQKIRAIEEVRTISMVTNGVLLNPEKVKTLANIGLDRLDISLNALTPAKATEMAGHPYPLERIKKIIEDASTHLEVLIAPVWMPGINDSEMGGIIEFAKGLGVRIGIQNYLPYKFGRNPVKPMPMPEFKEKMRALEQKHNCKLLLGSADFNIQQTEPLPKPFKRGDTIEVELIGQGRHRKEMLAAAQDRIITVTGCRQNQNSGKIRVKLTRSKHNIFYGRRV